MSLGEFDLIAKYFKTHAPQRADLGIGDDCALLSPRAGMQWAVSTDMLVEGRHFLPTVAPEALGHKALAVNLSDLAACGASPVAFSLALALPRVDEAFLAGFSRGLFALADQHAIELIGGDTTAGPLTICITVMGEVPQGQALRRDGARAGDDLWVSHPLGGGLGDARLALEAHWGHVPGLGGDVLSAARQRMERPTPRVALGLALRGVATSAIDLSDGLIGDLRHVLKASSLAATVHLDAMPVSPTLAHAPLAMQQLCLAAGGDDYELLFTAPPQARAQVEARATEAQVGITRIGHVHQAQPPGSLSLLDADGRECRDAFRGFDHFLT